MKINNPANFKLRLLAYLTDHLIMLLIFVISFYFILSQPNLSTAFSSLLLLTILIFLNPIVIYHSILFTHYLGGTPGKLLTGLHVTNENGSPLSLKRIMFRQTIGYIFSSLVFGLGYLAVAKDPQKQGWHDKTVGSKVIVTQNLWFLAILACIISFSFSMFFVVKSYDVVTTGPLSSEAKSLWKQIEENEKKEKANNNVKLTPTPSANSPLKSI